MPSVINSDNGVISGTSGLKTSGSNDGLLDFQSNGTRIAGITTSAFQVGTNNISAVNSMGFRNRIINGDMRIDQRNAGAAVTVNSTTAAYPVDRWFGRGTAAAGVFTLQQLTDAPAGFKNSIRATVTTTAASPGATDFYGIQQRIEGYNIADLGYGTASPQTVTLSFSVKSSVTGTFSVALSNNNDQTIPVTFVVSAANTWEQKTVTIAGTSAGTWDSTNGTGLLVQFTLGAGASRTGTANTWSSSFFVNATGATNLMATNGATFQVTGVQLEAGSVATPFERRDYGRELMMCQRYFTNSWSGSGKWYTTTTCAIYGRFPVTMRVAPTTVAVAASPGNIEEPGVANRAVSGISSSSLTADGGVVNFTTATANLNAVAGVGGGANSIATFSAEL